MAGGEAVPAHRQGAGHAEGAQQDAADALDRLAVADRLDAVRNGAENRLGLVVSRALKRWVYDETTRHAPFCRPLSQNVTLRKCSIAMSCVCQTLFRIQQVVHLHPCQSHLRQPYP